MLTPNPDIPNIPNTPEVAMQLSFGPARPVVLFPVRLETRFFHASRRQLRAARARLSRQGAH